MHALVSDDSKAMRMILKQILKEIGFEVAEAGNGMSQVVKALEADANEYVMKPFTKGIIREKLAILDIEP